MFKNVIYKDKTFNIPQVSEFTINFHLPINCKFKHCLSNKITTIKNVYVINLERCKDRKQHIIKEFKKNGLTKYEFFKAVDKDDKQVKDMMKTDYVKKFPPCFRCAKFICNCSNNFLENKTGWA